MASCAIESVRLSGMTRLTLIGATLVDYGCQLMFCLAVVACQRILLPMQNPSIDFSLRRLPRSAHTADTPLPTFKSTTLSRVVYCFYTSDGW